MLLDEQPLGLTPAQLLLLPSMGTGHMVAGVCGATRGVAFLFWGLFCFVRGRNYSGLWVWFNGHLRWPLRLVAFAA